MKKIVSIVLLLCLSMNIMAGTAGVQKLEREIDNFKFSMTVEWDQKDQEFKEVKTREFNAALEKILREDGISQLEVMALLQKKVLSSEAINAIQLKLSLLGNSSSPEALTKALESSTQHMYSQGASWNGEVMIPLAIGVIVVAIIAYKWWWEKNHYCAEWEYRDECVATSSGGQTCSTHTDSDGYSYETCDSYWTETDTITCGPMNHCVRYEKIK